MALGAIILSPVKKRLRTWASCRIRKIMVCACAGNAGNIFPATEFKELLRRDPGTHHGTCVTHVPWSMSGLITRGGGENIPSIPGVCATPAKPPCRIWWNKSNEFIRVCWYHGHKWQPTPQVDSMDYYILTTSLIFWSIQPHTTRVLDTVKTPNSNQWVQILVYH